MEVIMRVIFCLMAIALTFGTINAQIGEVKVDGTNVKIYDDNGNDTGKRLTLCGGCELSGYNSRYIVITDGTNVKIYEGDTDTGKRITLNNNGYIKKVTSSAILVKEGNTVKYYDFRGDDTGKRTDD
jgi:hypothetical protein